MRCRDLCTVSLMPAPDFKLAQEKGAMISH